MPSVTSQFTCRVPGGEMALHRGAMPASHLLRHQLRQRASQQLGCRSAEQPLRGGVERLQPAVDVHGDDRISRGPHQKRRERISGGRGGAEERRALGGNR
jgi:hypothetical protein